MDRLDARVTRIAAARELLAALEEGHEDRANFALERLVTERDSDLFREIGRLTRELHDALWRVDVDDRLAALARSDFPDARERISYVIAKTEQAAHRTLEAIEKLSPVAGRIENNAAAIIGDWGRFTRREMSAGEFRVLSARMGEFLDGLHADAQAIRAGLGEVLIAQDYQDLTGQVLRRIIGLVQEVEENLVRVISRTGGCPAPVTPVGSDGLAAGGPAVSERERAWTVKGQDDVDALLSSLGF